MRKLALLTLLMITAMPAHAADLNARDDFDFQPDTLRAISQQVAEMTGLPLIEKPKLVFYSTDLGGEYHFAKTVDSVIYFNPSRKTVKIFHTFHEMVHVYQQTYKYPLGHADCPHPNEVDAMLKTEAWNATHNGPTHDADWAFKTDHCKEF